jgi:hypothetical protein
MTDSAAAVKLTTQNALFWQAFSAAGIHHAPDAPDSSGARLIAGFLGVIF